MSTTCSTNVIIAGVTKAATTSLFTYLSAHPQICPSRVKETQHFLPPLYDKELPPLEDYERYFAECGDEAYRMEATVGYIYGGRAVASAIESSLDNARIIIVLREPIDRLFSFFSFQKGSLALDESLSFDEYVRQCRALSEDELRLRENHVYWGIKGGLYAEHLDDWFDVFGEENVRVLFFDYLIKDTRSVLLDLCRWLGVEGKHYVDSLALSRENRSIGYRNRALHSIALRLNWSAESFWRSHPRLKRTLRRVYYALNGAPREERISSETRACLEVHFRPYNERLAEQLTRHGYEDLPEWLAEQPAFSG